MNFLKKIFAVCIFIFFANEINATCNNKELNDWAEKLQVVYEEIDSSSNIDASYVLKINPDKYDLKVYVTTSTNDKNLKVEYDNYFKAFAIGSYIHFEPKSYIIDIYSNDNSKICPGEKLKTINFTVPPYNMFIQSDYCKNNPNSSKCDKYKEKNDDIVCEKNCDLDKDGKCDLNCDNNKDGIADLNIDLDNDNICDKNCDINLDNKPEINLDFNDDNICDINCDNNKDFIPDTNIDYKNDNKAHFNIDEDNDGIPDSSLIDEEYNEEGTCIKNCDTNNDGWPDTHIDILIKIKHIILSYWWCVIIPFAIVTIIYLIKFSSIKKKEAYK